MLGIIVAILTTSSFIPQALRVIRTKDTRSISLGMYVLSVTGIAMWLIYGITIQDLPLILANGVTLIFSGRVWARRSSTIHFQG